MVLLKQIITPVLLIVFLMSAAFLMAIIPLSTARADHTAAHCEEVFGASGNADWENCMANLPADTPQEPSSSLTLQPIDTSVPGTHDCNGVPIAVNVECVASDNPILSYLGGIVNFLAAGVGVVVVAMVTFSGVQYITSRGDPQKLSAAKARLINALIGLVCFIFLYAFLQWIIPGGLLNGNGGSGGDPPTQPSGPQ